MTCLTVLHERHAVATLFLLLFIAQTTHQHTSQHHVLSAAVYATRPKVCFPLLERVAVASNHPFPLRLYANLLLQLRNRCCCRRRRGHHFW